MGESGDGEVRGGVEPGDDDGSPVDPALGTALGASPGDEPAADDGSGPVEGDGLAAAAATVNV